MNHDRILELKIKIKSLADEAKTIRKEEQRIGRRIGELTHHGRDCDSLIGRLGSIHFHRTWDVRIEARCAQLAYAYLRGKYRKQAEPTMPVIPKWMRKRIANNVVGGRKGADLDTIQSVEQWVMGMAPPEAFNPTVAGSIPA